MYHFKNGADVAKANYIPSANIRSECENLIDKLKESADREVDDVQAVIQTFKSEVADNLSTLDPVDAITVLDTHALQCCPGQYCKKYSERHFGHHPGNSEGRA